MSHWVVTGPPRLQVTDDHGTIVGSEKWVKLTDLSACLKVIAYSGGGHVTDLDIRSIADYFLQPYNAVYPQALRNADNADEDPFHSGHLKADQLHHLAVSESFALDVMKAVAFGCFCFQVVEGEKKMIVAAKMTSSTGMRPHRFFTLDQLKKP